MGGGDWVNQAQQMQEPLHIETPITVPPLNVSDIPMEDDWVILDVLRDNIPGGEWSILGLIVVGAMVVFRKYINALLTNILGFNMTDLRELVKKKRKDKQDAS